jgi:hypothetical protein
MSKVVKLSSEDGQEFEVRVEVISLSETIKNMLAG